MSTKKNLVDPITIVLDLTQYLCWEVALPLIAEIRERMLQFGRGRAARFFKQLQTCHPAIAIEYYELRVRPVNHEHRPKRRTRSMTEAA